jgi:pimeloyl-ACP methyl ester carboxylesterase/DNA-binding CsgD family transcriptional regulator
MAHNNVNEQIRFCRSRDGVRIAYAIAGDGPTLVKAANWVTHLDDDWRSPVWGHWLAALAARSRLIRYDARGCGLSDRSDIAFSFDCYVEDLEAVVAAAAPPRFALFGFAGGGATAVAYAARHPERVSHLVLYGAFVRGRFARSTTPEALEEEQTLLKLIEIGWGKDDPSFRQLFVSQFLPDGTPDQIASFNRLMRRSASSHNAAGLMRAWFAADVSALAPKVACPTLVLHPRDAIRVPFEEGRALAGLIPGARFVPLDSRNLILLAHEPAWAELTAELARFLPAARSPASDAMRPPFETLTAREQSVLELIAQGLDNEDIAAVLSISAKTVRNNVSTILSKLDLHTRAQAIVRAREAGFGQGSAR